MTLQNRVDPWGRLHAVKAQGAYLDNRGILHDRRQLVVAQWKNKGWVTCRLAYGGRKRTLFSIDPMAYSELFFLDEATAFAAGHRPCAECRRERFKAFKAAWEAGNQGRVVSAKIRIAEIDRILHSERAIPHGGKVTFEETFDRIPSGTFVERDGTAFLVWRGRMYEWSFGGYRDSHPNPVGSTRVRVLTPQSAVRAFAAGFEPGVHVSTNPPVQEAGLTPDQSVIPKATVQAYRETDYRAGGGGSMLVLRVDEPSPALARLLEDHQARGALFITAFNPLGESRPLEENLSANVRLAEALAGSASLLMDGEGVDPSGKWPGEKSFLALDVDLGQAQELGRRFGQNAIVWAGPDAIPRLILLR